MTRIVILNRADPRRIRYDRVIDHQRHDVTYIGQFLNEISPTNATAFPAKLADLDADALPAHIEEACANCDYLVARGERDLILAAQIRERFNIPGDSVARVLPIRDKLTMRMAARQSSVKQPTFGRLPNTSASAPRCRRIKNSSSSRGSTQPVTASGSGVAPIWTRASKASGTATGWWRSSCRETSSTSTDF
uniref:hypothetical protein n=1 Tax=Neorhizobium sp. EC2-8 TaxID=3129230 RepID=UPI0031017145